MSSLDFCDKIKKITEVFTSHTMWKKVDDTYINSQFIFPSKQKAVGKMVDVCRTDENILRVIIFGSSTTPSCNQWSDVDIYFEMKHPTSIFPSIKDRIAFDKWSNFDVSTDLLQEIQRKGVVVYDRTRE